MGKKKKYLSNFLLAMALLGLVVAVGLYLAFTILFQGQTVYGSDDLVGWNLLIAVYVFMALTASGLCLTANFFEVLGIHRFQLLQKRAHFLAISFLVPALGALAMELGRIDRIFYYVISPNFASPMWWMGSVYAVYLVLLLFEFWAIHRNKQKLVRAASIITLIAAVSATSILGGIFGVILDKPLWFGSGTPIFFVFSAVISGIAAMILGTLLTYQITGKKIEEELDKALQELGLILTVLLAVAIGFTIWRLITVTFARVPDATFVIGEPYGMAFWLLYVGVGILLPFVLLLYPRTRHGLPLGVASAMVLVGMYVDKHIFVVAGQMNQPLELPLGTYTSTLTEWGIFAAAMAAAVLLYTWGVRHLALDALVSGQRKKSSK